LKVERNFHIHIVAGFLVIVGSFSMNLPLPEFLILILTVMTVLIAEMVNTVIEMVTDSFVKEYSLQAKRIKDVGAGIVMIAAVASVMVGYLVFAKHFPVGWQNAFENIAHSSWYITFIILLSIAIISIVLKFIMRRGSLLTGGMPSIHSGMSFAVWAIVTILTFKTHPVLSFLVLIPAFWVAHSRVLRRIHRVEEVIIGALTGILVTVLVFQLFWKFR